MIRLTRYPVVRQYEQADCGPASLLSVLRYWGGNASMAYVRDLARTDSRGSTMLGLVKAAEILGFDAYGATGGYDDLMRDVKLPCIVHVVHDGLQHILVLYKVGARGVLAGDPARGLVRLSRAQFESMWTSRAAILLEPGPQLVRQHTPHWLQWITEYLRLEQAWLIQAVFIGMAYTVIGLLTALFIQLLIDLHLPQGDLKRILVLGAALLALQIVRATAGYVRQRFLVELNQRVAERMGTEFLTKIFRLPLGFFESRKIGDITARLHDAMKIQTAIMMLFGTTIIDLQIIIGSLAFVFMIAKPIGWIAIIAVPVYTLILVTVSNRLKREQHEVLSNHAQLEASYIDSLSGIDEILGYHASDHFTRSNLSIYRKYLDSMKRLGLTGALVTFRGELAGGIIVGVILVIGAVLVVRSDLLLGQLMAGYSLIASMLPAVYQILHTNISLQGASVAATRLFDLLLANPESNDGHQPFHLQQQIAIRHGRFTWPRGEVVFEDLDLTLRPGHIYGLWGRSGSGKTTIVKVLERKYNLVEGELLVDEIPATEIDLAAYRRSIAVIPESVNIFSGTLAENILLGRYLNQPQILEERIREVGLESFIERFPQGIFTIVGPRGLQLSAGERQVVGFIRAILCKPQLLILDEGVNAVDIHLQDTILRALRTYAVSNIVLLISHQLGTLLWCDRLFVLEKGQITEHETPTTALEKYATHPDVVFAGVRSHTSIIGGYGA